MATDMDVLVLERFVLLKAEQPDSAQVDRRRTWRVSTRLVERINENHRYENRRSSEGFSPFRTEAAAVETDQRSH